MKPRFSGLVVLVASVALGSCGSDPTDSYRGEPVDIVAQPTSLFLERGQTKQVIVEVVDEQGNPLLEDVTFTAGAGITVVEDTAYGRTSTSEQQPRFERAYNVTANELVATSFTLSGGGKTKEVIIRTTPPVAEIPLVAATASGPNPSDPVTLTVPAPYIFPATSNAVWIVGADTLYGEVTGFSEDGRTLTVLPYPGMTTAPTVPIAIEYLPTTELATTTDVPLTVSATPAPKPGTNTLATAPTFTLFGGSGGFIDGNGGYGAGATECGPSNTGIGAGCQLYKFSVAEDNEFEAYLRWSNDADMGLYITSEDLATDVADCDLLGRGAGANQPEHCTIELPAGNYVATVVNFGPLYPENDPNPDWVSLRLTAH
jgi:hypothetical protein